MRHNKKFNHLSRKANHRASMLSNMACSLILHKRISTTLAKAKALRIFVEPILTRAKEDNMNNRRLAFSLLKQKEVVTELFQNVGEKIANRPGGYTRILRTGFRLGDAAEMCIIELVDYNENMLKENKPVKAKTTRRSRTKKAAAETEAKPVEAKAEEEPKAEEPKAE